MSPTSSSGSETGRTVAPGEIGTTPVEAPAFEGSRPVSQPNPYDDQYVVRSRAEPEMNDDLTTMPSPAGTTTANSRLSHNDTEATARTELDDNVQQDTSSDHNFTSSTSISAPTHRFSPHWNDTLPSDQVGTPPIQVNPPIFRELGNSNRINPALNSMLEAIVAEGNRLPRGQPDQMRFREEGVRRGSGTGSESGRDGGEMSGRGYRGRGRARRRGGARRRGSGRGRGRADGGSGGQSRDGERFWH